MIFEDGSDGILSAAFEVHRALGPGLLESTYQACMERELQLRDIPFRRQVPLPVIYKGIPVGKGYSLDFVVQDAIVVELKSVERLLPIHEAQLLTYLRLTKHRLGFLLNFNVPLLKQGIMRRVL